MIKCLILWHYYDVNNKLYNSSATEFEGTLTELRERISESHEEANKAREEHEGYSIVQQIVLVSC